MYNEDKIYTRRIEMIGGKKCYFVTFVDSVGNYVDREVCPIVDKSLHDAEKIEARIARSDRRHTERFELSDLDEGRVFCEPETTEDQFLLRECANEVAKAIDALPLIQRRRFLLNRIKGMTIREIAVYEGCAAPVVYRSIMRADKKIRKVYEDILKGEG